MNPDILEVEALRTRWRRAREPLRLMNPESDDFGTGGLARFVQDVGVRFLILPADPELNIVRFDDEFWKWWTEDRPNPFAGAPATNLGRQSIPTANAAVRFEQQNRRWEWSQFTALHRNGGLELGLGHEGVFQGRTQEGEATRGFLLTRIVGRIWHALAFYGDVVARFPGLRGPWEASLSFLRTADAMLGDVAAGWADFGFMTHRDLPRCQEPNLLFRLEVGQWRHEDEVMDLAFQLGDMVVGAWAIKERRWLIRENHKGAGTFDVSRYR